MPVMPEDQVQINWTGSAGHVLMRQSVSFIELVVTAYHAYSGKSLSDARVLDFGCGWGRLIRLLYKYVPADNIYGVDPWDLSIDICKQSNINANLYVSDYLPRSLPTPDGVKFDFIMAFSVFTHLSEKATLTAISTLTDYLSEDGLLAITIRPEEYWAFHLKAHPDLNKSDVKKLMATHHEKGFAFTPHERDAIEGDITYGDTSMTVEYIENNFKGLSVVGKEWSEVDPFQQVIFLKKGQD